MSYRYEIRLSGEGGQGIVLAGVILAEAAAIYDDKNATQTQVYGPESRGGASKAEVIISDEEIDYPKAMAVDLLLALTQAAADKYAHDLRPSGILVVDSTKVEKVPSGGFAVHRLPIIDTAKNTVGKAMVANIVSLGVIAGLSKIVSREAIEQAVLARVPKGTEELNRRALEAGFALAGSPKAA
ncbi:MAG: 2-oxoacid:acceptor oxidoreductase family protein [Candidatus Methylomirabilota bacterium]|jgi:2-oxoglutarate ferredoxin oxidoreductase subunit gamma